jgi:molybdopterin synthase sulfur carrier subunit
MITIIYFARLKEALGLTSEQLLLPDGVTTVEGLRTLLMERGGVWEKELGPLRSFRAAVNQCLAQGHTGVKAGDEVAFFPPVTGG